MKKLSILAIAALSFAACSEGVFTGNPENLQPATPEIVFGAANNAATRADKTGADAAALLGDKFVVYGTKHAVAEDKTADNDDVQFDNFQVGYLAGSANTTESNTANWDYVGKASYDNAAITSQAIKYWDYNTVGYTFYAFASSELSCPKDPADKVEVTKVTADATSLYNKGYQVTVKSDADLTKLYFSDRLEVAKANYGNTVTLVFRNMGSTICVGFFEDVPGYSVKIDKFYVDDDAAATVSTFAAMNNAHTDGFYAAVQNVKSGVDQDLNVTYYESGDLINRVKVTQPSAGYAYYLKLGNEVINTTLGTTAAGATKTAAAAIVPHEGNASNMLIKLDYTLTAIDGSTDEIKVRGASVVVPSQYVQWKSNYAYTYLFKISDKTSGTTGAVDANGDPIDPVGLFPITFDAVVESAQDYKQETITMVDNKTITTYALGAIANEYNAGSAVYATVADATGALTISGIGTAATEAQVYSLTGTNAATATEGDVMAMLNGLNPDPAKLTMTALASGVAVGTTIPLADGTTKAISNVYFTPAAGNYAVVYCTTKYVAPTFAAVGSAVYNSTTVYYAKTAEDNYYVVTVPSAAAYDEHKAELYVKATPGTAGVYAVKVVHVL